MSTADNSQPVTTQPPPAKRKRTTPLWVTVAVAVAGLVLGAISTSANNSTLREEITDLEQQLSVARAEATTAQNALNAAVGKHESEKAALTAERTTLLTQVEEAQSRADAAEEQASEQLRLAEETTSSAAPVPFVSSAPASSESTNIYYKNCTEARNAGAAPVYAGQPGYGTHLDRDGDGVGCE